MTTWTVGDTTCETLFMSLVDAQQIDLNYSFTTAGGLKMNQLQFYNTLATPDIILTNATMLASKFDVQFISTYLATYQAGATQSSAVNGMIQVLTNAQNTVLDLANQIQKTYALPALP